MERRIMPKKPPLEKTIGEGTYSKFGTRLSAVPLYDTATLTTTTGQTSVKMFATPVGQGNKTLADTNMQTAGAVANGMKHIVRRIKVIYNSAAGIATAAAANAFNKLLMDTSVQLIISGKADSVQMSLAELMGCTVNSYALAAAGAAQAFAPVRGSFELPEPIVLAEQVTFEVRLINYTGVDVTCNNDRIRICLEGDTYRMV